MILAEAVRVMALSAIAFAVALLVTPWWIRLLKKFNGVKQIRSAREAPVFNAFHEKKAGTPTGGGFIIWGTVYGLAVIFAALNYYFDGIWEYFNFVGRRETYLPLAALLFTGLIGLLDDFLGIMRVGGGRGGGLKIRHRLIMYTLIAAVGAWWFYFKLEWTTLAVPFYGNVEIGWWYIPIFIFIIVASAFSANETDGLDGLLGGVLLFAFAALTTVTFVLERYDLAVFGGMVMGSLLAFLWFNIYPARFFMGDTGSMSLGITLGIITMLTNTTLLLPLFGLILVVESISVIAQLASKSLFKKKIFLSTPIHHHFEAIGWHESQITMRFWIVSAIASGLGLVLFFLSRLV